MTRGGDGRTRRRRFPSNFTYISSWVKYIMFFCNFLFFVVGVLLVGIGIYAVLDKAASGETFK
jgi:tetraspanin-33